MKVICVDAKITSDTHPMFKNPNLIEGNVYNVEFEVPAEDRYGNYIVSYKLYEFPPPYAFAKNRFIPLSEIDEMELVNEKELVNS